MPVSYYIDGSAKQVEKISQPSEFLPLFTDPNLTPIVQAVNKKFYPMIFQLDFRTDLLENVQIKQEKVQYTPRTGSLSPSSGSKFSGPGEKAILQEFGISETVQLDLTREDEKEAGNLSEPFALWINPNDLSISSEKVISDSFVRSGHVNEHWGENLATMTASGSTPAFYTLETGLTRVNRAQSGGYNNLMALLILYRNNGCTFDRVDKRRIIRPGTVKITYDGSIYEGRFDSFSISEDATSPFVLTYSFNYTIRRRIQDKRLPLS